PVLAALASCNKKTPEPDQASTPPPVASGKPWNGPAPHSVDWDVPPTWQKAESPSKMRKATYKVPHAAGDAEDGERTVTQAGGTVDQNVTRWAGQFQVKPDDVKRQERKVAGYKATLVEIHGTYTAMAMPGAPASSAKAGFALLGAIVESAPPTF